MKNIKEYLRELEAKKIKVLKADIAFYRKAYDANPSDNLHLLDTIKEMEAELTINPITNEHGWSYFEEVTYLSQGQIGKLKSAIRDIDFQYDIVLGHINKLMYLVLEIGSLDETQIKVNSTRAKQPPINEILKILEFIPNDNEAVPPLIILLASIEGDHTTLIKNIDHKKRYIIEKKQSVKLQAPYLNIEVLAELKKEYKAEIQILHESMKTYNPYNYKKPTDQLLDLLKIPKQPSNI